MGSEDLTDYNTDLFQDQSPPNGDDNSTIDIYGNVNGNNTMSDSSAEHQRLHDKFRGILVNPLLANEVKKRNMRACCRTMWQHMWVPPDGSLLDGLLGDDFVDLQDYSIDP